MHVPALLLAVQESEGWWAHNSGSLLISVAAITAAALAAYVAIRNQRQQLDHDRRLRATDHIRDTIDDATLTAGAARQAMIHSVSVSRVVREGEDRGPDGPSSAIVDVAVDRRDEALAQIQAMHTQYTRLGMRLGKEHRVTETYKLALVTLNLLLLRDVGYLTDEEGEEEDPDDDQASLEQTMTDAYAAYQEACYSWLNEQPLDAVQ